MRKLLGVFLVALLVAQATSGAGFLVEEECGRACPGETPDGQCPPLCTDCLCCPASQVFVAAEPPAPMLPRPSSPIQSRPAEARTSMHPREILHVPRAMAS